MKSINAITVLFVVAVMGSAFAGAQEAGDIKEKMKINYEKMGDMLGHIRVDTPKTCRRASTSRATLFTWNRVRTT